MRARGWTVVLPGQYDDPRSILGCDCGALVRACAVLWVGSDAADGCAPAAALARALPPDGFVIADERSGAVGAERVEWARPLALLRAEGPPRIECSDAAVAERAAATVAELLGVPVAVVSPEAAWSDETVVDGSSIPLSRPAIADEEALAAARVVASGWLVQGPEVIAFEREFAAWVGAAHACAVSSGTAALHLALLAVGVRAGDEVITVSHSFIATANAVRACGAEPKFVDIEPDTLNIDVTRVDPAIGPRTRAILCVHQLGMPCDIEALASIARKRGLPLVEDAACAAGSEVRWNDTWQRIGRPHGDVACFSFHPRKLITTAEGGMVTTADAAIDKRVRALRQHESDVDVAAFNYRMSDVHAAIGRVQLSRLGALVARRQELAQRYRTLLHGLPLELQRQPLWARSNWQSFAVRLSSAADSERVVALLVAAGVRAGRGIANAHERVAYARSRVALPSSEWAARTTVLLPFYEGLGDAAQRRVVECVKRALGSE